MTRVAIVIIGDEILSGKFVEENAAFAIPRLREVGARVVRVSIIPDELDTIADEVRRCAALADWVITSGGVGPTHDDMSYEGVARALGRPLQRDHDLAALFEAHGVSMEGAAGRMADLPEGAVVERSPDTQEPIIRVENILILPGVPRLFHRKLRALLPRFAGPALHTARVYTPLHETEFATELAAVAEEFPQVSIGSYPRSDDPSYRTVITLEAGDADALRRAEVRVQAILARP